MKKLKNEDLAKVNGGGISLAKIGMFGAVVSFIIGVVRGFARPFTCSSGK